MLTATNKIVNHLTKIFYWICLRLNSPFDGYSHSQAIPGRRRAVHRPIHLTYFARLFMLSHMPIILIEQQLDTGPYYLIYNSEIVTRRQIQHDSQVDQGCPSAIFCLLSQIVQTDISNWPSIRPGMTIRY